MRIARVLGYVLAGLLLVFILAGVGAAVALSFIDFNRYKPLIADAVREATGRELAIAGDLAVEISLSPGIVAEGVTLSNADWGSRPEMVAAERLEIQIAAIPLIYGSLQIQRIELSGADVLLETDREGRANFAFAAQEGAPRELRPPAESGGRLAAVPLILDARIRDFHLTYVNGVTGATHRALFETATLTSGGPGAPMELDIAARYHDVPLRTEATLGALSDLLSPGGPWPVDIATEGGGAKLTVTGTIAEPLAGGGLDLAVSIKGRRAGDLSALLARPLPALGAYSLSGKIGGDAGGTIDLSALTLRLGESDISGSATVSLADRRRTLRARLSSQRIDLPALGIGAAPLRDTAAVLALRDGALTIESFRATLAGAAIDLAGTIVEPAAAAGLDLSVGATGAQLADLSVLAGTELPKLGAYSVTGRFNGNLRETFRVTNIGAKVGESDLKGDIAVTLTGDRPLIDADLSSGRIDLVSLGALEPTPGDAAAGEPEPKPDRLFPDDPLPLEWLKAADVTIRYDAATVNGRQPLMRDAAVILSLKGGHLEVESVKAVLQNGILEGAARIDGRKKLTDVTARMALRKVDLAILLAQTAQAGTLQGQVNFEFDVTGRGNSIRQIMASLDGQVLLAMGKGQIRSRTLQTWVGGPTQVLSNVLTLNVGGNTRVKCALASFYIKQGLATSDGLLLDTDVAAFVGKGTVNLETEAVDVIIDPKVKRLTLSAAVPVHIRGTLMRPTYSLDQRAVALRVGGLLGGLFYPPALIIGLGELGTFTDGDCVGMKAPPGDQGMAEQTAPTKESGPRRFPGRIIQGTGDSITRGLQRLFGQ